jgi:hypothetical protein
MVSDTYSKAWSATFADIGKQFCCLQQGDSMKKNANKILFISNTLHQTKQMHAIAEYLPGVKTAFSPGYGSRLAKLVHLWQGKENLSDRTCFRNRWREYTHDYRLTEDLYGKQGPYEIVVTTSDQVIPDNIMGSRVVLVQDDMLDPENWTFFLHKCFPAIPRWLAGTAALGQSRVYQRFCVASEGYRNYFIRHGLPEHKLVVTGIPLFDNYEIYTYNNFPYRDYVLICMSNEREMAFRADTRKDFLEDARRIAKDRKIIVKLQSGEQSRMVQEVRARLPQATIITDGCEKEMVANASVVICQHSSLAVMAIALQKETYSYWDNAILRELMPIQNRSAAKEIARVCSQMLEALPTRVQRISPAQRFAELGCPLGIRFDGVMSMQCLEIRSQCTNAVALVFFAIVWPSQVANIYQLRQCSLQVSNVISHCGSA